MASEWDSLVKDLPFSSRKELCKILDANRKWADLAGKLEYGMDDINGFSLALMRLPGYNSPTDELLSDWEHKCPTLDMLYNHLMSLRLKKAADIISKYVERENQKRRIRDNRHKTSGQTSVMCYRRHDDPKSDNEFPDEQYDDSETTVKTTHEFHVERENQKRRIRDNRHKTSGQTSVMCYRRHDDPKSDNEFRDEQYDDSETTVKTTHEFHDLPGPSSNQYHGNFQKHQPSQTQRNRWISDLDNTFRKQTYAQPQEVTTQLRVSSQISSVELGHIIPYEEIKKATYGFDEELLEGRGVFGEVYKGILSKNTFAVKKMNFEDETINSYLKTEMENLRKLCHQNLIQMIGYSIDGPEVCVVCEFMVHGSLKDRLSKNNENVLGFKDRCKILAGAASALQYLHNLENKPQIHGDIKSSNILLDQHNEAKLSDVGIAMISKQKRDMFHDLKAYLPPEFHDDFQFSVQGDVYSFGIVIFECCTGEEAEDEKRHGGARLKDYIDNKCGMSNYPYMSHYTESMQNTFSQLCDTRLTQAWPSQFWSDLFQLGQKCTVSKKKARPVMADVYQHLLKLQSAKQMSQAYSNMQRTPEGSEGLTTEWTCNNPYNNIQGPNRNFYDQQSSDPKFSFNYSSEQYMAKAEASPLQNRMQNVMGEFVSPAPSDDHLRNNTNTVNGSRMGNGQISVGSTPTLSKDQAAEITTVQVVENSAATNVIEVTAVSDPIVIAQNTCISSNMGTTENGSALDNISGDVILVKNFPSFVGQCNYYSSASESSDGKSVSSDRASYSSEEIHEKSWPSGFFPNKSIQENNDYEFTYKSIDADIVRNCDRYRTKKDLANEEKCISDPGMNTDAYQYHRKLMIKKSTLSGPQASSVPVLSPPIYTG